LIVVGVVLVVVGLAVAGAWKMGWIFSGSETPIGQTNDETEAQAAQRQELERLTKTAEEKAKEEKQRRAELDVVVADPQATEDARAVAQAAADKASHEAAVAQDAADTAHDKIHDKLKIEADKEALRSTDKIDQDEMDKPEYKVKPQWWRLNESNPHIGALDTHLKTETELAEIRNHDKKSISSMRETFVRMAKLRTMHMKANLKAFKVAVPAQWAKLKLLTGPKIIGSALDDKSVLDAPTAKTTILMEDVSEDDLALALELKYYLDILDQRKKEYGKAVITGKFLGLGGGTFLDYNEDEKVTAMRQWLNILTATDGLFHKFFITVRGWWMKAKVYESFTDQTEGVDFNEFCKDSSDLAKELAKDISEEKKKNGKFSSLTFTMNRFFTEANGSADECKKDAVASGSTTVAWAVQTLKSAFIKAEKSRVNELLRISKEKYDKVKDDKA